MSEGEDASDWAHLVGVATSMGASWPHVGRPRDTLRLQRIGRVWRRAEVPEEPLGAEHSCSVMGDPVGLKQRRSGRRDAAPAQPKERKWSC
jgi:hypothetical protein